MKRFLYGILRVARFLRRRVVSFWHTVNRWFRWPLLAMLLWALLIYGVGTIGSPIFSLLFTIISAAIVFCLGIMLGQPAIGLFAFLPVPQIRGAARWVVTVFALEVAMGAYFVVVPVGYNNTTRYMGAVAVFLMVTAILFRLAVQESWVKWVKTGLWGIATLLTVVIFWTSITPKEVAAASNYRQQELNARAAQEVREGQGSFTAVLKSRFRLWFGDPKSPPSPPPSTKQQVSQQASQPVQQSTQSTQSPKKARARRQAAVQTTPELVAAVASVVPVQSVEKPLEGFVTEYSDFTIQLTSLRRVGDSVRVGFLVKNNTEREMVFPFGSTFNGTAAVLYDDLANEVEAYEGRIGNRAVLSDWDERIPAGLAKKGTVSFRRVSREAGEIRLLRIYTAGGNPFSNARVEFENIPF